MDVNPDYMVRALQLARNGAGYAGSNPMVGAVIVAEDRIIGEGWHRCFGQGHAEVNAAASVAERELLHCSTMYVTLEPCSHYGKTPPCAKLIADLGIPRVVVGCLDPFEKVSGRGVEMLREAGVDVVTGVLERECRELNKMFMTAHTTHKPYVTLKYACSADGYMDVKRVRGEQAKKFSSPLGSVLVHMMRSRYDAIMVGSGTVLADDCRLDVRYVDGRSPLKVVVDRSGRVPCGASVFSDGKVLYITSAARHDLPRNVEILPVGKNEKPDAILRMLYEHGITSLLVEGGKSLLGSFISSGEWNDARIECSDVCLGDSGAVLADVPEGVLTETSRLDNNVIFNIARCVQR